LSQGYPQPDGSVRLEPFRSSSLSSSSPSRAHSHSPTRKSRSTAAAATSSSLSLLGPLSSYVVVPSTPSSPSRSRAHSSSPRAHTLDMQSLMRDMRAQEEKDMESRATRDYEQQMKELHKEQARIQVLAQLRAEREEAERGGGRLIGSAPASDWSQELASSSFEPHLSASTGRLRSSVATTSAVRPRSPKSILQRSSRTRTVSQDGRSNMQRKSVQFR
jgi:hypothetical protein